MGDAGDEKLMDDHHSHLLSDEQIDECCFNAYEKNGRDYSRPLKERDLLPAFLFLE
jgi:hypothetical protein